MTDQALFREAMSRLGAAVSIITTDGPAGRAGMTVSAVCSVTDNPPTLLVCINRSARAHEMFVRNRVLCVNILRAEQEELSGLFAGKADQETRFSRSRWHEHATGAPVLEDAMVSFDCTLSSVSSIGTHSVIFARVEHIELGRAAAGLFYFGRRYHAIGLPESPEGK